MKKTPQELTLDDIGDLILASVGKSNATCRMQLVADTHNEMQELLSERGLTVPEGIIVLGVMLKMCAKGMRETLQ